MIELSNQPLRKNARIDINAIINSLIIRIKLNKENKELNKTQINEDLLLVARLVKEQSEGDAQEAADVAAHDKIVPLYKAAMDEKDSSAKERQIVELFKQIQKLDLDKAEDIIEDIMRITTAYAEQKPNHKYALRNLQFYVHLLEESHEQGRYLANAYVLLGRAYFTNSNYTDSLTCFTKAIESQEADDVANIYLYRAKTHEKQNNISLALADCEKIIALGDPTKAAARFKITLLQQEKSLKKKDKSAKTVHQQPKESTKKRLTESEENRILEDTPIQANKAFKIANAELEKGQQCYSENKVVLDETQILLNELKSAHSKNFQSQLDAVKKDLNDALNFLKRYEANAKEIDKKVGTLCEEKRFTTLQSYLKKSTEIIEKSPKQYDIMQKAAKKLQSIKLDILQLKKELEHEKSEKEKANQLKLQKMVAEKKLAEQQKQIKQKQDELKRVQVQKEKKEDLEKKEKQTRKKKKEELAKSKQAAIIEAEKKYQQEKEKADAINKAYLKKEEEAKKAKAIKKQIFDHTENVIPHAGLKILFEFKDTLKRHNATIVVGGSSAYKIGLIYAAIMAEDEKKLALYQKIEVNDNDIAITSKKEKPKDKSQPPIETALLSLQFESTPLFKLQPRETPYPKIFTNFAAEIKNNQGTTISLDTTVRYEGYPNPRNDLIPLAAIKCYFANKKHPTLPSIEIGELKFLVVNDPKGIIQATFKSGIYDFVLPDPDDTTEITPKGIFERGFRFYLKMDGILSPGPEAQKMLKTNNWAHYYFARHYFAKTEQEDHIQSCYKEMAQLIRKKNIFSKKELNSTIVALSNIALLNSIYKPSEHYDLVKETKEQDGKPIADYCAEAKLTDKAQKIADFLQMYYKEKENVAHLKFSELFPLLIKHPQYLDHPNQLLKKLDNLLAHPIHVATLQDLIERNEFYKPENHESLYHYLENFLLIKSKQFIPPDKISGIAKKLADDLQFYYKIAPLIFTPPTLHDLLDRILFYPELFESDQNSILSLDNHRPLSHDDSVTYITSLLECKLTYDHAKPFLEAYCDHIIKADLTLALLTSQQKNQLRVNMALFIYQYFQKMTPGIQELEKLLSTCILTQAEALANCPAEHIITRYVEPQVAFYKTRATIAAQSSPLYCGPYAQPDLFVYLDSKNRIPQTPSPAPRSSSGESDSPPSIPLTPEYKSNPLTRSPPSSTVAFSDLVRKVNSPVHKKKIQKKTTPNLNQKVPTLISPKMKIRT